MVFTPSVMDPLCHDDDGTNPAELNRTLSASEKLQSTLGTKQEQRRYNELPFREQMRCYGPTRNRKKTNCLNIRKNNPKSKSYDSTDASSCSEDEAEREAEEDPEAEEDKEGSAAGKSSPTPNGQGLSLHKKPRGRSQQGTNGLPMRWDGPKEAGRWVWVVDNGGAGAVALGLSAGGGSQDDPIDLCD